MEVERLAIVSVFLYDVRGKGDEAYCIRLSVIDLGSRVDVDHAYSC